MPNSNKRKPRNGNRTRKMGVSKTQIKSKFNGKTVKNRPDPPTFVSNPWNQLTVPIKFTVVPGTPTRALVTSSSLANAIYTQIGFPSPVPTQTPPIELRLKTVRACLTTETPSNAGLNIDVYDFMDPTTNGTNGRLITSISDVQGRNHYANVGFTYPEAHVKYTLGEFATPLDLLGIDISDTVVVYFYLMWRFEPPQNSVIQRIQHKFELLAVS